MTLAVLSLLLFIFVGWTTAVPTSRYEPEIANNPIDEQEVEDDPPPEVRKYFETIAALMQNARYVPPNEETGMRVANYDPKIHKMNPEELGNYYQGDIMLPLHQGRNGVLAPSSRWPKGVIPYEIAPGYSSRTQTAILNAFNSFKTNIPCMSFVSRKKETAYIYIQNTPSGCHSNAGRVGGRQIVNLQEPGCVDSGTIIHELTHAAGFFHEQSREDRDKHLDIKYENIQPGMVNQFDKVPPGSTTAFGVPYTYNSVMHYSAYAFSKNGQPTMVAKPNPNVVMGQRNEFDPNDIKKLRAMYGCPA